MHNNITRGIMKKKFLFVLALLSILTVTGCKEKTKEEITTLSAPQQISVQSNGEKSLIIFDEVKNADYYDIYINDVCVTVKSSGTGTIQFDASKIITLPQKYTIKVKASSDTHFDSAFTEEYEYQHTSALDAPVISIDGTTLNWNKVPNAEFYDVLVTSYNPTVETMHRFPTNTFDFTNILVNKGEYSFKVRAVSESGEYVSSIYSNQVTYAHILTLETPRNLNITRDKTSGEMLLSFVSSENVNNFTINIDGINYGLTSNDLDKYLVADDFDNLYILKLTSFAKVKGISVDSASTFNVCIKANSTNEFLKSSEFSSTVNCQFSSVLETPRVSIKTTTTTCKIEIGAMSSPYLSAFTIYLNNRKYKTISSDIRSLELPLSEIGNAGLYVQSISNNANCYSSNLSEVVYPVSGIGVISGSLSISYSNGFISWNTIDDASGYIVEISNVGFRYSQYVTENTLDISDICDLGHYSVKVIAMANGFKQVYAQSNIDVTLKLTTPTNATISTISDNTYLSFDEVNNAYGYVIYLNSTMVNRIFTNSPININSYLNESNSYNVKVKAISVANDCILESDTSVEQTIQSVKTLSLPTLTISKDLDKYYLNVYVDDAEKELSSGYEIWINYQSIGVEPFQDAQIDITSYFANAGQYVFMVKAKAIDSPYIKDSNMASITYNCIKQLDIVTDIQVTKLSDESKYILTFKEQTLAAKYLVTIAKEGDEKEVEFELNRGMADISAYLVDNGVYRVYVKALALKGSFYIDSPTSGNPYRLTKGETLGVPSNISIEKITATGSNGEVNVTWDKVNNAIGYQVYIYYNTNGNNVLQKSIFVSPGETPTLNIGSGEHLSLNKEGLYTIQIKAVGDDELYETSQTATMPYSYTMENQADFNRNAIFMYGKKYNYNIDNANQLANLLWYHYLYNEDVWNYNTLEYNLKVYCSMNLDTLAETISENVANQVEEQVTNVGKMNIIAQNLLKQYPEIANYTLGKTGQAFCLNEEKNVYIFRYVNTLDNNKTSTITTTNKVYGEKLDTVDAFDQRTSTYVFAIDNKATVDVTTTEQLFMALQYNKKPNFVGDCEVAKAVYENARFILRQICSDDMSEYQKTLQIYNFLTKHIALNDVNTGSLNEDVTLDDLTSTLRGNLKDYYLEGILYNASSVDGLFANIDEFIGQTATSEGLSKTFVVLCAIEGIDAIKVNGKVNIDAETEVSYSWNKVFIKVNAETEKQWYAIDLAGAISHNVTIKGANSVDTYQLPLHNYFLIADSKVGVQATSWHNRLGDTTDYVASETYEYYTNQRFSCNLGNTALVTSANFKATKDEDITNVLIYGMLKANKKHRVVIDIEAEAYISSTTGGANDDTTLAQVKSKISNILYENARVALNGLYNCTLNTTIIDARYIVFVLEGFNYNTGE